MFARKRSVLFAGTEIDRTPLLVPSFSSKGFPEIAEIVRTSEQLIDGPMLISAYDLHYDKVQPPFDFASLIFLDSGGYEASKDADLSDLREREHEPATWTPEFHKQAIGRWKSKRPTVLISYDHPNRRLPLEQQIQEAARFFSGHPNFISEILLKPETLGRHLLDIEAISAHIHSLAAFDIIGVTEKEIGDSILNRMENLAKFRIALETAGLFKPIHVFGSLDTITTFLYFVAGADIFDGLTWLRYGFKDGNTMYRWNYGALVLGVGAKAHVVESRCWFNNYYYINDMQLEMRRFLNTGSFSSFKHHGSVIEAAYNNVTESVGGQHGRR